MAEVPGLLRVSVLSTLGTGQKIMNTFALNVGGVSVDNTYLDGILTALNSGTAGEFKPAYLGMLDAASKLDEIRIRQVPAPETPHAAVLQRSVFPAAAGTNGLTALDAPAEATGTLTLQTGLTSRRARGRLFMPPPRKSAQWNGENFVVGGTYLANAITLATWFLKICSGTATRYTTGALSDVVLSVYSRVADVAGDTPIYPCVNVRANAKVHWLRSRAA